MIIIIALGVITALLISINQLLVGIRRELRELNEWIEEVIGKELEDGN